MGSNPIGRRSGSTGRTDPLIIQEIVSKYGVDDEPGQDLYDIYLSILPDEVRRSPNFQVLAGARELVIHLSDHPGFLIGLATGNVETGARLKLERAGLSSYFPFGGYGSDSGDRTELIRTAIRRGSEVAAPRGRRPGVRHRRHPQGRPARPRRGRNHHCGRHRQLWTR